jgi:translocation protein SEC63
MIDMIHWLTVIQAVPLTARKATGGSTEGAPFLQLPHFSESVIKKIARKVGGKIICHIWNTIIQ